MKHAILGLLAATLVASPTLATSWKDALFAKLDTNQNKLLDRQELTAGGCDTKYYRFIDIDRDEALTYAEFFRGRELLGRRCK